MKSPVDVPFTAFSLATLETCAEQSIPKDYGTLKETVL
jgi:hypothetical protein